MRLARFTKARLLSLAMLMLWASCAYGGGSLRVNPVRLNLGSATPTAAVTLENNGSAPMVLQLQLMQWSSDGTEEQYHDSDDILATPPIMTIAPGKSQIVRVGLSRRVDPQRELAYRLFIEEVPPPPKLGYQGLQVALRVGVPIFVEPATGGKPVVQWHASRAGDKAVTIDATNAGNAHLRLFNVRLHAVGEERLWATQQLAAYLLPGQSKRWMIASETPLPLDRIRLSADTDHGVIDADLVLGNP